MQIQGDSGTFEEVSLSFKASQAVSVSFEAFQSVSRRFRDL